MKKISNQAIEKFWTEKEIEAGEKIKGKTIAEFIDGYRDFSGPILGLLFYTENALHFQTFPKENWFFSLVKPGVSQNHQKLLNFNILWVNVIEVDLPPKRNKFIELFLPQSYRIFIDYQQNKNKAKLVMNLQHQKDQNKLIEFYKKIRFSGKGA